MIGVIEVLADWIFFVWEDDVDFLWIQGYAVAVGNFNNDDYQGNKNNERKINNCLFVIRNCC